MKTIERAMAQNLLDFVETAQHVAPDLGAAAIACAGNVGAFLGSGSPLTTVKGAGPSLSAADIETAEAFFLGHGVHRAVFELAPWVMPDAIGLLTQRGYQVAGSEDVVVRKPPFEVPTPGHRVVPVSAEDWPALMLRVDEPSDLPSWDSLAEISALLPGVLRFAVLDDRGDLVSCAELAPASDVAIFGNDATLESARGRGAQQATIQERLRYAADLRFRVAAAEVAPGSTSERNYIRCGFSIAYTRTHYARELS
jgi:hypothetical protein